MRKRQCVALPRNLDSDSSKEFTYLAYGDAEKLQPDVESEVIRDPEKGHPPRQGLRDRARTMTGLGKRSSVHFADRLFVNPTRKIQILTKGATYTSSSILAFVGQDQLLRELESRPECH